MNKVGTLSEEDSNGVTGWELGWGGTWVGTWKGTWSHCGGAGWEAVLEAPWEVVGMVDVVMLFVQKLNYLLGI